MSLASSAGSVSFREDSKPSTTPPPSSSTAAAAPPSPPLNECLSGPQNYQNLVAIGTAKGKSSMKKIFVMGIMAGAFISFGCVLMTSVGGNMPGLLASNPGLYRLMYALVFPFGLLMVMLSGAELYTGNTATVTMALLEGKVSLADLVKNFVFSYLGNLVGSLFVVSLVIASGTMTGNTQLLHAAVAKTSLPFGVAVVRAVLANWLVCIAVVQAASASSLVGKMFGLWWPITAFVTIGLEHSVANMFLIPAGIALGAKVTFADFLLKNLLPVTLGNTIAGVILVATVGSLVYGTAGKKLGF